MTTYSTRETRRRERVQFWGTMVAGVACGLVWWAALWILV